MIHPAQQSAGDESVSKAQLNLAVNRSCTCGGRPPGTPSTCPACEVWHRLFGDITPPKPVPLTPQPANAGEPTEADRRLLIDILEGCGAKLYENPGEYRTRNLEYRINAISAHVRAAVSRECEGLRAERDAAIDREHATTERLIKTEAERDALRSAVEANQDYWDKIRIFWANRNSFECADGSARVIAAELDELSEKAFNLGRTALAAHKTP